MPFHVTCSFILSQPNYIFKTTHGQFLKLFSGADPGFPVGGGVDPSGGMDLRRGCFSVQMYVRTKELCPVGRVDRACPLDPPMRLLYFRASQ